MCQYNKKLAILYKKLECLQSLTSMVGPGNNSPQIWRDDHIKPKVGIKPKSDTLDWILRTS
jgi:hypothetical protein